MQPTREDMQNAPSVISAHTYRRRFGSWRKALEAFVEFVNSASPENYHNSDGGRTDSISSVGTVTERCDPKSPRSVSWRLRFLVMRRDAFKCRCCGASPAAIPGVHLEVDHIIPWSKGGETIYENLQTLCQTCNGGKSDLPIDPQIDRKSLTSDP